MAQTFYYTVRRSNNQSLNHSRTLTYVLALPACIFLHGRDSNGQDFADEFFESEASEPAGQPRTLPDLFPGIRWVFPTAPILRSQRFDTFMSPWFDIWSVEEPEERVETQMEGLKQSIAGLTKIIRSEEILVPRHNIFLGGISQGFATALSTFFANGQDFAGMIGLCGWMPFVNKVQTLSLSLARQTKKDQLFDAVHKIYFGHQHGEALSYAFRTTPIFLGHSIDDIVVPIENGRRMRDVLMHSLCLRVHMQEYEDGGHWVNEPWGVDDIVDFLRKNMDKQGTTKTQEHAEQNTSKSSSISAVGPPNLQRHVEEMTLRPEPVVQPQMPPQAG